MGAPTKSKPSTAPSLPNVGYLDRDGVLAVFPVGREYWDQGVRNGKYPAPVRLAPRKFAWKVEDIKRLIRRTDEEADLLTLKSKTIEEKLTLEAMALQWLNKRQRETSAKQCAQYLRWLEDHVFPFIGKLSPKVITVNHIVQIVHRSGRRVSPRTGTNVKQMMSLIFRFGIVNDLCAVNPAGLIRVRDILPEEEKRNHPAIRPEELPDLMGCLARNDARLKPQTRLALRLLTHTFVRNKELRLAEWSEIDFKHKLWLIPAHRMKMRRDHLVPLSRQCLAILRELKLRAGKSKYVFPSMNLNRAGEPMAENVCLLALARMGYAGRHCPHGYRSLAETALLEKHRVRLEYVELQLAHKPPTRYGTAYHRALYLPERTKTMQLWSNYVDQCEKKGLQSLPYGSEPRSSETFSAFRGLNITSGLAGTKPLAFDK